MNGTTLKINKLEKNRSEIVQISKLNIIRVLKSCSNKELIKINHFFLTKTWINASSVKYFIISFNIPFPYLGHF